MNGTRWRRLTCGRRASAGPGASALRPHLRPARRRLGVGLATTHRYVTEAIEVLAPLAPTLSKARQAAATKAYVILDGTLPPIDRTAADRPFYSGKHKRHGMNVQVITDPFGKLLWASPALPGAIHDLKAARTHGIIAALAAADLPCWADKGYQGADGTVRVPFRGRWHKLSAGQQAVNRAHAKIRALGEQAMAILKSWRLLRKLRCSTGRRITDIIRATLFLELATSR